MATLLPCEALHQLSSFSSWDRFSVCYTHASFFFNEKCQVIKYIASYNPSITFRVTLLATLRHVVDSFDARTTIYVDICAPDYFRRKETKTAEKGPLQSFTFLSYY